MADPRSYTLSRSAVRRRFFRAIESLQEKTGWSVRQMADHYHLPLRTIRCWLRKEACPKLPHLKKLCRTFNWRFEVMFEKEAIIDEMFERTHLDLTMLNRRFLELQQREPLESWNYVSLAGAMVFNAMSSAGYECRAFIDHSFGTRITFMLPALASVGLKIEAFFGSGLMISWIDEEGRSRSKLMNLSNSTLDLIQKTLHSLSKS